MLFPLFIKAQPEQKVRQLPKTLPVAPNMRDKFSASDSESTFNNYNNNSYNNNSYNNNNNSQFNSTVNNTSQPSPLYQSNEQLSSASSPRSQVRQLQRDFDLYNSNSQLDSAPVAPARTLPSQLAKKMLPQGLIRDRKANESNNVGDNLFLGSNNSSNNSSNNCGNDNQFNKNVNDRNYNKTNTHNFSNPIRKVSNAQQYLHSSNESLSDQFESNKTTTTNNSRFYNRNMNDSNDFNNNGDSMYNNSNTNTTVTNNSNSNFMNSKHLSPSPSPPLAMQQNSSYNQQPQKQNNFSDFEDYNKQG